MDISAIFKAVLTPDKDRSADNYAAFKPGDKLIGTVLRLEADGRALIDLGRFRALAHTTIPVQVGQKLPLKVIQTGTPTHLRLDTDTPPKGSSALPRMALTALMSQEELDRVLTSIDRLLSTKAAGQQAVTGTTAAAVTGTVAAKTGTFALESAHIEAALSKGQWPESVQHALRHLRSVFDPLPTQAPTGQQAQWIQSAVEDRGIFFELKLADVLQKAVSQESSSQRTTSPTATTAQGQVQSASTVASGPTGSSTVQHPGGGKESGTISGSQGPGIPGVRLNGTDDHFKQGLDGSKGAATKDSFIPASTGPPPSPINPPTSQGATDIAQTLKSTVGIAPDTSSEKSAAALKDLGVSPENQPQTSTSLAAHSTDPNILDRIRHILANDLKPQLLILKNFFDQAFDHPELSKEMNTKDVSILRQVVQQLLSHVDQQQEHAVRRAVEPDLYQVFTHLLPVKDQADAVRLKVYYPKKGHAAENDPQHRIALLLDMDQLGLVRADLNMIEQQLRIQFYVRDDSIQQMFAQHTPSVAAALEGHFETIVIDTRVSMEKIQQFEGEDLAGPPLGRIDVTV